MIEPARIPGLKHECLTKDMFNVEASIDRKMAEINGDYNISSISDINMQCVSTSETGTCVDQLLSDQLLSFSVPKTNLVEKRNTEKIDSEDSNNKNLYEGLLMDKCSGEDGLLTNPNQDWSYFESFISESKIELLDLCSKNELSVNLFSEEDVDNYMFDDDDDSTLSSDVCSLKIRYESFQDNVREKTNVLQEETQFNFFPSILVNGLKKDSGAVKQDVDELPIKPDELGFGNHKECVDDSSTDQAQEYSTKCDYFTDSSNSADDTEEYSDDSSTTFSDFDTFKGNRAGSSFSQKYASCSKHLNYGLRSKRKMRYSDDYLYYVDSTEGDKSLTKLEKPPIVLKQEEDSDWRPIKRRKHYRKDPPSSLKYSIINRFKGDKCMAVKLGRIDSNNAIVNLDKNAIHKYEQLSPLKAFWLEKEREREEPLRLAAGDKHNSHHHAFGFSPFKRKHRLASRLRIQRAQAVEQTSNMQGVFSSYPMQEMASAEKTITFGKPLTIVTSGASTLALDGIMYTAARKSRSQEMEEKIAGSTTFRIQKFKSESRFISKTMTDLGESNKSRTNLTDVCLLSENMDTVEGDEAVIVRSAAVESNLCKSQTTNTTNKITFVSTTCSLKKEVVSENVPSSVPVIPGGYLQTLLDPSDPSGNTSIPFFPQQPQHSVDHSLETQQFASIQLAQSCVLSPPSESEQQQSPQNCPGLTQLWHSQLAQNQSYATAGTSIQHNGLSVGDLPLQMTEGLMVSNYSQLSLKSNRLHYEKTYVPEQPLLSENEFQACRGQQQFKRATAQANNGQLITFNPVASLSATSSIYSSLSHKSREKEGEDDANENFLAHCSPKVVIQRSLDAITPLRESTDLLDISNFTPDKFRHTSLSELSPPETPSLSPQVMGLDVTIPGKSNHHPDGSEVSSTKDINWNSNVIDPQDLTRFSVDAQNMQSNAFNVEDKMGLKMKNENQTDFACDSMGTIRRNKSKRKSNKQTIGQGTKKGKASRSPKTERSKNPRQTSRTSKKMKGLQDGKGQAEGESNMLTNSSPEDLTNKKQVLEDQQEFEEPSNILSNIVSGMAEVQRFMMASVEPLWSPMTNFCLPSDSNSLKLKTLKILAGTSSDLKKKEALVSVSTKARKSGTKAGKGQAKFNTSFFPQLNLGCNMFDKPNLGVPGINGPAHKKMYRHKTSAKFPRIENLKGALPERNTQKDISLTASFEKLR